MTRNAIVLLGTLTLLACQKDEMKDRPGSTTITGASADAGVTVEQIRSVLIQQGPRGAELSAITITNDNGVITLRGKVEDEASKREMLNTVRGMSNVKSVRDELQVSPKQEDRGSMQGSPLQGGSMQGGSMQGGSMQGGMGGTAPTGAQTGSMKTKNTESVRSHLKQDKAAPATVITDLMISDDGELIIISGVVPDQKTHDAVLKSAQKTPGVKGVRDDLKIKGQ